MSSGRQPFPKIISLIIPVYNEEMHVEESLKKMMRELDSLSLKYEIIVVESGSSDNSRNIIERTAKEYDCLMLIHQEKREGMGSAVRAGFNRAKGDYLFWIDSDLPYDLKYLKESCQIIGNAHLVAGYRLTRGTESFKRAVYSRIFNFLANLLFSIHLKDINFSFKLFKREIFNDIEITSNSSFFAAEILAKCRRKNYKIKQIPVEYKAREQGKSKLGNIKTIFAILREMIKFLFTGRAN